MAKSTCTDEEGCDRPAIARGLCTKHYQRAKAKGLPPLPVAEPVKCKADLCPEMAKIKGYCEQHYRRVRETGDPRAGVPIQKKRRGRTEKCIRDGCDEPYNAMGLCKKHYMEERTERLKGEKCKNPECDNPRGGTDGYCPACYQRVLIYGDPNAGPPRRKRRTKSEHTGTRSEYHVNHAMVRKERGPAWNYDCGHCGERAQTWAQIHGTAGNSPDHYLPLCWPCHAKYDDFADRLPDNIGSKRIPEARQRMSDAMKRVWETPGHREKMSEAARQREARKREAREQGDAA